MSKGLTYNAWLLQFQTKEQATKHAFAEMVRAQKENEILTKIIDRLEKKYEQ